MTTLLKSYLSRRDYESLQAEKADRLLKRAGPGRTFTTTYRDDPVAFVHDCIKWREGDGPARYQDEALQELPVRGRVAIRGPHGLGKTALKAWAILWFALTRDGLDWKIPTTASAWRQLQHFLWPEVHKWARRLDWVKIGRQPFDERSELLRLSLKLGTGEAFAMASDKSELIEGAHADHLLYIFDEAKTIPAATFDAAEGAFSAAGGDVPQEALAFVASTPGDPSGRFYDIHSRKPGYEDWWVRHVSKDEAIRAGRVSVEWAEQRKRQWGESSAVYQNRVDGQFASSSDDGVIPLSWVELANERWHEIEDWAELEFTQVGADIARSGPDRTVMALRFDWAIKELRRSSKEDTMQTSGRITGALKHLGGRAIVDVIGIGAGVVDRLREAKLPVIPFNASERTERTDSTGELGFVNKRSAGWWNLREILDPGSGIPVALPPDDLLTGDLVAPKWKVMSGGRIQVESKDDIKKRIGRSTDDGDAVVMAYWDGGNLREIGVVWP